MALQGESSKVPVPVGMLGLGIPRQVTTGLAAATGVQERLEDDVDHSIGVAFHD